MEQRDWPRRCPLAAAKKKGGFRFRQPVLDELKAMVEGPPPVPGSRMGSFWVKA
jgi:hypothetical protein